MTLGAVGALAPEAARKRAKAILGDVARGEITGTETISRKGIASSWLGFRNSLPLVWNSRTF